MNILVLNGPSLQLLGKREPEIYGSATYSDLVSMIEAHCKEKNISVEFLQSNHEGILLDAICNAQGRCDAIVINPAAYTHTSIALYDAVQAVALPTVEVHISNPDKREDFRKTSYIRAACVATIAGKGFAGYLCAIDLLADILNHG